MDIDDLGEAEYYLGIRIVRNRANRTITLTQDAFVNKVLAKFGMKDCKPVSTPMEEGEAKAILLPHDVQAAQAEIELYQSLLGHINYAAIQTRFDALFACSALMKHLTNPSTAHISAAKRLLCYFAGTKQHGLRFGRKSDHELIDDGFTGFTDASYASQDLSTMKSQTGYVFFLNHGAISCMSKRQDVVALSSTEAEFYAIVTAAREALWLKQLLQELRYRSDDVAGPIALWNDNQGALSLSENPEIHQRTKHIAVKWSWIRDVTAEETIQLGYCNTDSMVADGLTKPLGRAKHSRFMQGLNLHQWM